MPTIANFVEKGISNLAELQAALQLATQLEFATLPPYLCAEWSVNNAADPDDVTGIINGIAKQEMFHFAFAGNMLTAIGGLPSVANSAFIPKYPTNVLPGDIFQKIPVDLKPLSADQLQVFMQIEYPEFPPLALTLAARPTTIGAFYDTISSGFTTVNPAIVPHAHNVKLGEVFPITSVADALSAIALIKGEGEGTEGSPDQPPANSSVPAHYYAFKEILTGHRLIQIAGKWSFSGTSLRFPAVFDFHPATASPNPSAAFNRALSQLLGDLQNCWTLGVKPNVAAMFQLQSLGQDLIQRGIRPDFIWADPT